MNATPAVFDRARRYRPRSEDVFVVTQMRCGTTWMQQLVYQIVTRGAGDFDDHGHRHLYAISPWIDAVNSVSIDAAPLLGERPTRIIGDRQHAVENRVDVARNIAQRVSQQCGR